LYAGIHLYFHLPAIHAYTNGNSYAYTYTYTNSASSVANRDRDSYTYFDTETFTDAATSSNAPATPYSGPAPVGLSLKKMVQLNHLTNR